MLTVKITRRMKKRPFDESERIPLSPINSPTKQLTKRQEQNRAAQRAFRERRAQTLKEMESRLTQLERVIEENEKSKSKMKLFDIELQKLKEQVETIQSAVDALSIPAWTVPTSDDLKPIYPVANEPINDLLGALRPSSTDPTLSSNS